MAVPTDFKDSGFYVIVPSRKHDMIVRSQKVQIVYEIIMPEMPGMHDPALRLKYLFGSILHDPYVNLLI